PGLTIEAPCEMATTARAVKLLRHVVRTQPARAPTRLCPLPCSKDRHAFAAEIPASVWGRADAGTAAIVLLAAIVEPERLRDLACQQVLIERQRTVMKHGAGITTGVVAESERNGGRLLVANAVVMLVALRQRRQHQRRREHAEGIKEAWS